MPPTLDEALRVVQAAADELVSLAERGWVVEDGLRSVSLEAADETGAFLLEVLDRLAPLTIDARLATPTGFRLGITNSRLVVLEAPEHLTDHYGNDQLAAARRIAEGDVEAVGVLADEWTVRLTIDLARPLGEALPGTRWRVARSAEVAAVALADVGWARIGDLTTASEPLHIVVLRSEPLRWVSPAIAIVTPEFINDPLPAGAEGKAAAVKSASGTRPPNTILLPEDLLPTGAAVGDESVGAMLRASAAASAWAWLADEVVVNSDGSTNLDFFGWRHISVRVPKKGLDSQGAQGAALDLYRWVTAEESPDRFLAVKQVLSVYSDDRFLFAGADVRRGAEPLYRSLRSSVVAEVVASQREARRMAGDAAREAADAVLASAKSVSERTIAALVALGGLTIASATSTALPNTLIEQLAFAVGIFMIALALWAVFIEGPTIGLPLSALESDLGELDELIGPETREQILNLKAVMTARRRARTVKIASPVAYLVVAVIAMGLAHPYPTWLWSLIGLE